ncbi:glycoside hydrolase family 65 protein [Stutzerimonas xanthomarina]|uniref:glycoside hydrolase family 65 protein n=1 Tax=Stutzerimonas xanthomarina TaxID=271420 RepID=UPI0029B47340|nr:glycoside hydrolase family 65 protein [Stutzerimonas xanthomarina]MDX2352270.1 glycoside hydrolase family 65 protein [Stutzerimonas xanthomarina]
MAESNTASQIVFEHYDRDDERRREALLALGSGVLSWRASAPEAAAMSDADDSKHYAGFYRAGWYDQAPREVNGDTVHMAALVNLPDPFGLSFALGDGDWFSRDGVDLQRYRQALNLNDGALERQLSFELAGHRVELLERRLVSMATPNLAVLRWELQLPPGLEVRLRSVLDGGVVNAGVERNRAYEGRRLQHLAFDHDDNGTTTLSARLHDHRQRLAMAMQLRTPGRQLQWRSTTYEQRLIQDARCVVPDDGRLIMEKRVVVLIDEECPVTDKDARSEAWRQLPGGEYEQLEQASAEAWRTLWQGHSLASDDPELQRTLLFHAFHLLQTVSPHSVGRDLGFPPRGWMEGYYGQVFWDELFAFPVLATHWPELARSLLDYRYARLDKARERAHRAGLRGAMFPWRSAGTGEEETPPWQCNPMSGRWMADHTRLQRHIGSAVAYDAWQLYLATADEALLAGPVGELIIEVARFWASIAQFDASRQRYLICGVIGPDEYHNGYPDAAEPGLNNNTYTNLMAAWALDRARQVLALLSEADAGALRERLVLEPDEPEHWQAVAEGLYLPFVDDQLLSQFEGFDRLEPPPQEWLHGDRPRLDWMLEARHDSCDRYQLTKQADVLMAYYLVPQQTLQGILQRLGYPHDAASARRTLAYHLARITHESSLSKVVCAGALADIDLEASWAYYQQALATDLGSPGNRGTQEGVHLGAMSGSLDVLQRHYLGVRLELDGLHLFPSPPASLPPVSLSLLFRQARLHLQLANGALVVRADSANVAPVPLHYAEGKRELAPGESLEISFQSTS